MQLVTTSADYYNTIIDQCDLKVLTKNPLAGPIGQDLHLILAADILSNNLTTVLKNIADSLKSNGYALLEETEDVNDAALKIEGLLFVAKQVVPGKSYVLLKKQENLVEPIVIQITDNNFSWLEDVKAALKKAETDDQKVLLVNQGEEISGI